MNNKPTAYLILSVAFIITLMMGVLCYIAPPAVFPDPGWGFQAMRSMEHGGGFNLIIGPDQGDVAKDVSKYLTWWSPGQYLVPYFFKNLLHISTARASVITIVVSYLLGLTGLFAFFKKVGFTPLIAALSIVFIASQQFYYTPFIFYNGGEVTQMAFFGWFLYGCFYFRKLDVRLWIFILLSGWIGFFCKSAMMWVYAAGLLCLWINLSQPQKFGWAWIKKGFWLAVPAVISIVCIYLFFLRKGDNPAAAHDPGWRIASETFSWPLASPMLAGFSVDDLTNGLMFHPDGPMFSLTWSLIIIWLMAIISVIMIIAILRRVPYTDYKLVLTVFYIVSILFFSYAYVRQAAISYEGRHYRIIGILIAPGVIYLFSRMQWMYRSVFLLAWLFLAYVSYNRTQHEYWYDSHEGEVRGHTEFIQQFADQPSLNYLMQLDQQQRNAIFVFTSNDLGLEIEHNRIITIEPIEKGTHPDYQEYLHKGHAGPLHIFLYADYAQDGRDQFLMRCFPGYKNFTVKKLSKDYVLYSAE